MAGKYAAVLVALPVAVVVYWAMQARYIPKNEISGFESWTPSSSEIAATVEATKDKKFEAKMEIFCREFKSRFRQRQVAVSEQFEGKSSIKLLCAAVMPKWDMAKIAESLSQEASDIFKTPISVTIYETYISMAMKEVGVLTRDQSGAMSIDFATGFPKLKPRADRSSPFPVIPQPQNTAGILMERAKKR
ncbi:MAG: hypothetical protein ABJA67_07190 [Chthonomonadales bacterium]